MVKEYICDVTTQRATYFIDKGLEQGHEGVDVNPDEKEDIKGKVYAMLDGKIVKEIRIVFYE